MNIKLKEKINDLIYMNLKTVQSITYRGEILGYLCRDFEKYIVAIDFDFSEPISEEFVGIKIYTNYLNISNKSIKVLCLETLDTIDFDKFSYIAANFLDKKNRRKIKKDPYIWIDEWKKIFGNHIKNILVYDVLGELIVLKKIYENDRSAIWMGPKDGTHDIVCDNKVIEVKTTTNKSSNSIHISSAFQLSKKDNEKLYFCRLEAKPKLNMVSINSIVNELIALGYSENSIENNLILKGLNKGSRLRKIKYQILELREYEVNENDFPIISKEKINEFAPRKNILNYNLEIDLTSIDYKKII